MFLGRQSPAKSCRRSGSEQVTLLQDAVTQEGTVLRSFIELPVVRSRTLLFFP